MKSYGWFQRGKRNKWLDFDSDLDHHTDCPIRNPTIIQQIKSEFWWDFHDSFDTWNNWLLFWCDRYHNVDSLNQGVGRQ